MTEIKGEELSMIKGGISPWFYIGAASLFFFVAGVVDGYVRPLPCHKQIMQEVKDYNYLIQIFGGLNISGTILNSISKGIKTVYEIGQKVGTAIRRIRARSLCKIQLKILF